MGNSDEQNVCRYCVMSFTMKRKLDGMVVGPVFKNKFNKKLNKGYQGSKMRGL